MSGGVLEGTVRSAFRLPRLLEALIALIESAVSLPPSRRVPVHPGPLPLIHRYAQFVGRGRGGPRAGHSHCCDSGAEVGPGLVRLCERGPPLLWSGSIVPNQIGKPPMQPTTASWPRCTRYTPPDGQPRAAARGRPAPGVVADALERSQTPTHRPQLPARQSPVPTTTARDDIQHWATAPRSSTNYSPHKTPPTQPVSHRSWNPNRGAGQPVTRTCIRPLDVRHRRCCRGAVPGAMATAFPTSGDGRPSSHGRVGADAARLSAPGRADRRPRRELALRA